MSLLTVEFRDGAVREWHLTSDGVATVENDSYTPSLYVAAPEPIREDLAAALATDPKVVGSATERRYLDLRCETREPVLRVDLDQVSEAPTLAHELLSHRAETYAPGTVRLYNVDLAPGFRYCVDTDTPTVPVRDRELRTLELSIPERGLVDGDPTAIRVDGETLVDGTARRPRSARGALTALRDRIERIDPDVLVCSTAQLVPFCHERAAEAGLGDFRLGRDEGYERLAGENTYASYGRVGHSPARYAVPGRALVDRANSFLFGKSGLPGLLDLVERSRRPLQETARGSIGTILTSIEAREALARDVLVPWNKWEPERFKLVRRLHDADRGGFTFAPDVGLFEDVVEVDFASLYPTIMCEYNVSPETVGCDCHDRADVPGLGYSLCDEDGFLGDVLRPLVDDRAAYKRDLDALRKRNGSVGDESARDVADRIDALEGKADALKWILVSCFGYQGYRNAKFGRIECHEAINAIAREILLDAKDRLEAGGWRVRHGIVDSLWVQARESEPEPIERVAARVTDDAEIPLEVETRFAWVCFVPTRDSRAGALTKYFGKVAGADPDDPNAFTLRGIEARQRSTPSFVADVQRALLRALDRHRDPEAVCDRLGVALGRLDRRDVDPDELVIRRRVSKRPDAYGRRTRVVAALERARRHGLDRPPGRDVSYVVVDDGCRNAARVRLAFEDASDYDVAFYRDLLVRAAESVVSPLGWDRKRIRRYLRDGRSVSLSAFE